MRKNIVKNFSQMTGNETCELNPIVYKRMINLNSVCFFRAQWHELLECCIYKLIMLLFFGRIKFFLSWEIKKNEEGQRGYIIFLQYLRFLCHDDSVSDFIFCTCKVICILLFYLLKIAHTQVTTQEMHQKTSSIHITSYISMYIYTL